MFHFCYSVIFSVIYFRTLTFVKAISSKQPCEYGKFGPLIVNPDNEKQALLFIDLFVWTYDISSATPLASRRIEDVYKAMKGPIRSVIYNSRLPVIRLLEGDLIYEFDKTSLKLITKVKLDEYLHNDPAGFPEVPNMVKDLTCATGYCEEDKCYTLSALNNGGSFECFRWYKNEKPSQRECNYFTKRIKLPMDIAIDLGPAECRGLLITTGVEGTDVNYRIMYTDRHTIHYYEDSRPMYQLTFNEVFQCSSRKGVIIAISIVLVVAMAAPCIAAVVFFVVIPWFKSSQPKVFSGSGHSKSKPTGKS